jgi:hypothetical protein
MMLDRSPDDDRSLRVELRPLDPDDDPLAPERFERAVASRIAAAGVRPSVPRDPLYGLWSLPRPVLLAASLLALAVLGISIAPRARTRPVPATIAESMGVPPQLLASGPR